MKDIWQNNFQVLSPAYNIFSWLPTTFTAKAIWPSIAEYNLLTTPFSSLKTESELPIQFVGESSELGYEPTIYLKGRVLTRAQNWHDFFNMMIWYTFPLGKSLLNSQHYQQIQLSNSTKRSAIQNLLTLFDESGVVVVSSDINLLDLIRNMSWKELFWYRRQELTSKLNCFIFGHSLHEKLLNPYIGLVGHSILIPVESGFFSESLEYQIKEVDQQVKYWLADLSITATPRDLLPIPILGFPGWHLGASSEDFYSDTGYFRGSRGGSKVRR